MSNAEIPVTPEVTEYAARLSPRRIRFTVVAVMAGMFLAAVDGTVVATAMPTVVRDLHGVSAYAWPFSVYLLTEVASIPLWGKLADTHGRKWTFFTGMAIFLVGSMLCGFSQSMTMLIAFRAVQGIGAGALIPVAQTIIGDLFTIEQRVRISALFGAVFGVASIAGPLVGGFITDNFDWRWVFYVNVPIGLAAMALVAFAMIEPIQQRVRHRLDWPGAVFLLTATGTLIFGLEGGRDFGWSSPLIVGSFGVAVAFGVLFVLWERHAPEPIVPLDLVTLPVLRPVLISTFLLTIPLFAVISFLPLFVTVVMGGSATSAGTVLTPLMLGSIISSFVASRLILKVGYRPVVVGAGVIALGGLYLLTTLGVDSGRLVLTLAMVLCGIGMGPVFVVGTLVAQNSVEMQRRGVASSLVNFVRQLGGALGVAVAGAVMITGLTTRLMVLFPGAHMNVNEFLTPPTGDTPELPPAVMRGVQQAFAGALHHTFVFALVAGVFATLTAFAIPKGRPQELHDVDVAAVPVSSAGVALEPSYSEA